MSMIFSYNNGEEVLNNKSMQWRQHKKTWFDTHHFRSVSFDLDHLGPFAKWTVGIFVFVVNGSINMYDIQFAQNLSRGKKSQFPSGTVH